MSSENWLQNHSLVAKKLTLMDALTATMVPHSATYVPILNKPVASKVFKEVMWLTICVPLLQMLFLFSAPIKNNPL